MGDAAELAMEAEMRYPYMDPVDAYAQYCDDLVSKNEKMNKLSFVFEAPNDMTAKQARIIIEQALEWAASDYAACQKENDKYPTDDDEYQKKYDALDSLTLMYVEPVNDIEDVPVHGLPEFPDKYTGNPKFKRQGVWGRAETFGDDLYDVQRHNERYPKTVWTVMEGDEGDDELIIAAGYRFVNRLLYFVSNEEWDSEEEEYEW